MIEKTYTIISDEGLHARPASKLVGAVSPFSADVKMLYKEREVNLKSIMGVMSLGVSKGHTIKITADGSKKADQLGSPQSQPQPQLQPQPSQPMLADLSIPASYGAVMLPGPPPVHQYRGPNGEILYGLLPPNHPEMICLQQGHDEKTHYGVLGAFISLGCPT